MSTIGISDPYPSDDYIVAHKHDQIDKDVYEALLDSHDFFGFGENHAGGPGTPGGGGTNLDSNVVSAACSAPIDSITYNVDSLPELITYSDTSDFTGNSRSISYSSGLPDQILHTFNYDQELWTVTKTVLYSSGLPSSTTVSVVKA